MNYFLIRVILFLPIEPECKKGVVSLLHWGTEHCVVLLSPPSLSIAVCIHVWFLVDFEVRNPYSSTVLWNHLTRHTVEPHTAAWLQQTSLKHLKHRAHPHSLLVIKFTHMPVWTKHAILLLCSALDYEQLGWHHDCVVFVSQTANASVNIKSATLTPPAAFLFHTLFRSLQLSLSPHTHFFCPFELPLQGPTVKCTPTLLRPHLPNPPRSPETPLENSSPCVHTHTVHIDSTSGLPPLWTHSLVPSGDVCKLYSLFAKSVNTSYWSLVYMKISEIRTRAP